MINYNASSKKYSIDFDGTFIKQLFKFCAKGGYKDNRDEGVLGTPWYDNGKIYATDSIRIARITLNNNYDLGNEAFSFNKDACVHAKKGMFNVNSFHIRTKTETYENVSVYPDGKYPNADKLFPKSIECVAEPKAFNATFMADIFALAASIDKNMPIKFSFTDRLIYFEFNTEWGKCDGLLMPIRL